MQLLLEFDEFGDSLILLLRLSELDVTQLNRRAVNLALSLSVSFLFLLNRLILRSSTLQLLVSCL